MAEYIAKLHDAGQAGDLPTLNVKALTEFDACALALPPMPVRVFPAT